MATTALTIVNNVLARLREDPVTSATFASNTYAQLILRFVNEAKRECEDAWNWQALRQTLSFVTVNGTIGYTLTGAGQRFRFYDDNKTMLDTTNRNHIFPAQDAWMEEAIQIYGTTTQFPNFYRIRGVDANGDPNIDLYPTPNGAYTIKAPLVIPEADLTLYTSSFKLPSMMIELGAWAKAIGERGEDGGQNTSEALQTYKFALGDAISQDAGRVDESEIIWAS